MVKPNVTADEKARCLSILRAADGPIVAAALAGRLFLAGSRETRRRHVRAIIRMLRDEDGAMIAATLQGGYFLTDDEQDYKKYLERRQLGDKKDLGKTYRQKRMITFPDGQGALFGPRIACGIG